MQDSLPLIIRRLRNLWRTWTEPTPAVKGVAQREQAQLLASLLLAGMAVGLVVALIPPLLFPHEDWAIMHSLMGLTDCALLFVIYRMTRQGRTQLAATLLAFIGAIAILINALFLGGQLGLHVLYYLSIPSIYVCLVLPARSALSYGILQITVMLTFAALDKTVALSSVFEGPLVFNIALLSITLLIVRHRNRLDALTQADLLEATERYRILSEMTYDYAYVLRVEPDGSLVREWLTDKFVEFTGYSTADVDSDNSLLFYHPEDRALVAADLANILQGESRTDDYRALLKDGSERLLRLSRFPVWDEKHEHVVRIYGMARDVTEEKLAEARDFQSALARARFDLVSRFFRAVSHDFRTSLAIIETNRYLILRLVERKELDQIPGRIQHIGDQIKRLTSQLENLKEVSSLNSPITELCNMNELVARQAEAMREPIAAKNLHLSIHTDPTTPPVRGNPEKLSDAISHLLDNAIHFTPENGSITLSVYHDPHTVMIDVKDTGVGISPEDAPHIFDFFYRADQARSIQSGGIGLGLSIARMVADAYGGKIIVDSTQGEGSTFTLAFPAALPEPIPMPETEPA